MSTRLRKKPDATSFVIATQADVSALALRWNAPPPITALNLELVFHAPGVVLGNPGELLGAIAKTFAGHPRTDCVALRLAVRGFAGAKLNARPQAVESLPEQPLRGVKLLAGCPNLISLRLEGNGLLRELAHRTLQRLELVGMPTDALVTLSPDLPALRHLQWTITGDRHGVGVEPSVFARLLAGKGLPSLVELDLGRCTDLEGEVSSRGALYRRLRYFVEVGGELLELRDGKRKVLAGPARSKARTHLDAGSIQWPTLGEVAIPAGAATPPSLTRLVLELPDGLTFNDLDASTLELTTAATAPSPAKAKELVQALGALARGDGGAPVLAAKFTFGHKLPDAVAASYLAPLEAATALQVVELEEGSLVGAKAFEAIGKATARRSLARLRIGSIGVCTDTGAQALAAMLRGVAVKNLDVGLAEYSGAKPTVAAFGKILDAASASGLRGLDLSRWRFVDAAKLGQPLAAALGTLEHLTLANVDLGDAGATTLASGIAKQRSLRALDLEATQLTATGLATLGLSLAHGKVERLLVRENEIFGDAAERAWEQILTEAPLVELEAGMRFAEPELTSWPALLMRSRTLRSVWLQGLEPQKDEAALAFARVIGKHPSLTSLKVRLSVGPKWLPQVVEALAPRITRFEWASPALQLGLLERGKLAHLHLNNESALHNKLAPFYAKVANAKHLTSMNLDLTSHTTRDFKALVEAIEASSTLQDLSMYRCGLSLAQLETLLAAIGKSGSIHTLRVMSNAMSPADRKALRAMARSHASLRTLS